MTTDVVAVTPETPVAEVAAAMGSRGISGVPVVDDAGRVAGVISEKDFLTHMGVAEPQNFMVLVAPACKPRAAWRCPSSTPGRRHHDLPAVTVAPEAR